MIELLAIDHNGEVVKASDITCQTSLQAEKIYFALISLSYVPLPSSAFSVQRCKILAFSS